MKSKFKLFQPVIAKRDLVKPDLMGAWGAGKTALIEGQPGVLRGTFGAVVDVFEDAGEIAVEFFDDEGETIDAAFIPQDYLRPATAKEVARRNPEESSS